MQEEIAAEQQNIERARELLMKGAFDPDDFRTLKDKSRTNILILESKMEEPKESKIIDLNQLDIPF